MVDPLAGALVAALAGWLSILVAVHAPSLGLPVKRLRVLGGLTIGLFGLLVLGVPMPAYLPVAVFAGGVIVLWATAPRGAAAA